MKKLLVFVLAMLVLTVVFVSCSCDGTGEPVETPAESTTESTPTSEPESTTPDPVVVDPPVTSESESSTNASSSTPVPCVADSQFVPKDNETVYAFPNTDGVYNEGKQVNYYSAPAISEGDRAAVHLGYYSDGSQFKRVGIYFEDQEKGYGWSKILLDDGKVIYIRNSVLTTDPNYAENAKSTTTETTDPKPQINVVSEDKFKTVNEQVKVYPRSDDTPTAPDGIYNPNGKAKVYSSAATNKDNREDLLLDEDKWYTTGTTLTRVGIYIENPTAPKKDQTGWSKIALEDGSFVYMRNWVLLTPEEYAAKTAQQ